MAERGKKYLLPELREVTGFNKKSRRFSSYDLKETYSEKPLRGIYNKKLHPEAMTGPCPNCGQCISIECLENVVGRCFCVKVKCYSCAFYVVDYIASERTRAETLDTLVSHTVRNLISGDLLAQTERELEHELEMNQRYSEVDFPF